MSEIESEEMISIVAAVGEKVVRAAVVSPAVIPPPVAPSPPVAVGGAVVLKANSERAEGAGQHGERFVPGVSGNKVGRPAVVKVVRDLARQYSAEAFEEIVDLMRNCRDPKVRMVAAKEILDRAWGKVVQGVEVTGEGGNGIVVNVNVREKQKEPPRLVEQAQEGGDGEEA